MKLFDRQNKWEINLYAYYDHAGIVRHLEDMARPGWQLEKAGSVFWTYRRCKPAELRYALVYFPKASQFDPQPPAAQPESARWMRPPPVPGCRTAAKARMLSRVSATSWERSGTSPLSSCSMQI